MTNELYNETYRPQFHFSAKKNWLNDPNGLVFYKGEYHLFFQHNPTGIDWGNMHWGHAVSPDLVHWEELPIALAPDALGTCFSGSAVVDWNNTAGFQTGPEKVLVAIYTAAPVPEVPDGPKFSQCIAYSNDRGRTWTKYDKNPVLPHIIGGNRDPKVIWHKPSGKWIMALYKDGHDYAFFSSPNLKEWTHLSDLNVPGSGECPDIFQLPVDDNKDKPSLRAERSNPPTLIVGVGSSGMGDCFAPLAMTGCLKWLFLGGDGDYLIGSFDGTTFTKEAGKFVDDYGANSYATQSYSDIPETDGRRIQVTWMNGGKYPEMPFNQQMTFPCELTLRTFPEGVRMCKIPVKEIELLHDKEFKFENLQLAPGDNLLGNVPGDLFDIRCEWEIGDATEFGIKARSEAIAYNVAEKKLTCLGRTATMEPVNNRVKLQILVDRASIEVFGNDGKIVMSSCFVPHARNKGLETFAAGAPAKLASLDVYTLKSAWRR